VIPPKSWCGAGNGKYGHETCVKVLKRHSPGGRFSPRALPSCEPSLTVLTDMTPVVPERCPDGSTALHEGRGRIAPGRGYGHDPGIQRLPAVPACESRAALARRALLFPSGAVHAAGPGQQPGPGFIFPFEAVSGANRLWVELGKLQDVEALEAVVSRIRSRGCYTSKFNELELRRHSGVSDE